MDWLQNNWITSARVPSVALGRNFGGRCALKQWIIQVTHNLWLTHVNFSSQQIECNRRSPHRQRREPTIISHTPTPH